MTRLSLLERTGVSPAFAITGGMAKNKGVINRLRILQSACGV